MPTNTTPQITRLMVLSPAGDDPDLARTSAFRDRLRLGHDDDLATLRLVGPKTDLDDMSSVPAALGADIDETTCVLIDGHGHGGPPYRITTTRSSRSPAFIPSERVGDLLRPGLAIIGACNAYESLVEFANVFEPGTPILACDGYAYGCDIDGIIRDTIIAATRGDIAPKIVTMRHPRKAVWHLTTT